MIVTFYSFKGGVGRSMALANVAEILADRGYRVIVCDWDLEAPGLERYLVASEVEAHPYQQDLEDYISRKGLIDLLLEYKAAVSSATPGTTPEKLLDTELSLGPVKVPRPSTAAFPVSTHIPNRKGWVRLLTAGKRDGPAYDAYVEAVRAFDWNDFYDRWAGDAYLEAFRKDLAGDLRSGISGAADILLIDSRTGITEQGGVCTHHLADLVVLLSAANDLNLEGCRRMAKALANERLTTLRGNRPIKLMPVASRIEQSSQKKEVDDFRDEFVRSFREYVLPSLGTAEEFEFASEIKYMPYYSFKERVVAREGKGRDQHLFSAYQRIAEAIVAYGRAGSLLREIDGDTLTTSPAAVSSGARVDLRLPAVMTYVPGDAALARDLSDGLRSEGVAVWTDPVSVRTSTPFEQQLVRRSSECGGYVVIAVSGELDAARFADYEFAIRRRALHPDFRVVVITTPGSLVGTLANYCTVITTTREAVHEPDERSRLVRSILAAFSASAPFLPTDPTSPFPGAVPFRQEQARYLFGRDDDVLNLLRLASGQAVRWWHVTGATGVGKSSLVLAGLVPAIVRGLLGRGDKSWTIWTPGSAGDPVDQLAAVIAGRDEARRAQLRSALLADETALAGEILRRYSTDPNAGFILVLDDVGRLSWPSGAAETTWRTAFDGLLATSVARTDLPFWLVTTMREESAARFAAAFPRLSALVGQAGAAYSLPPLGEEAVQEVLHGTTQLAGLSFEAGLSQRIAAETRDLIATPAFLMLALQKLWVDRRARFLTHASYDAQGGLQGVVLAAAERLWTFTSAPVVTRLGVLEPSAATRVPDVEQERASNALLRLVSHRGEAIRARRSDVLAAAGDGVEAERMLARLCLAPPLVAVSGDDAQLSYRRLPAVWSSLGRLVFAAQPQLVARDALESAAAAWEAAGRSDDGLPTGRQLAWLSSVPASSAVAKDFLDAARAREKAESEQREKSREMARELVIARHEASTARDERETEAAARSRAEQEAQRFAELARRRTRHVTGAFAAISLLVVMLAGYALFLGSDRYQVRQVEADASTLASTIPPPETLPYWLRALVLSGRTDDAAALVRTVYANDPAAIAQNLTQLVAFQINAPDLTFVDVLRAQPEREAQPPVVAITPQLLSEAATLVQDPKFVPELRGSQLVILAMTARLARQPELALRFAEAAVDGGRLTGSRALIVAQVAALALEGEGAARLASALADEALAVGRDEYYLLPPLAAWMRKLGNEAKAAVLEDAALREVTRPDPLDSVDPADRTAYLGQMIIAATGGRRDALLERLIQRVASFDLTYSRNTRLSLVGSFLLSNLTLNELKRLASVLGRPDSLSDNDTAELAIAFARAGDFETARTFARQPRDSLLRASTMLRVGSEVVEGPNKAVARELANQALSEIQADPEAASDIRRQAVLILAAAGDREGARRIASEIPDPIDKASAYTALANGFDDAGRGDTEAMTGQALQAARGIGNPESRDRALAYIGMLQADLGKYTDARATAAEISVRDRLRILSEIVVAYQSRGNEQLEQLMNRERTSRFWEMF